MNQNKWKLFSFVISYWLMGLVFYYLVPNIRGYETDLFSIIFWPLTAIFGLVFISGGMPYIITAIIVGLCEFILKHWGSFKLSIVFYGFLIPIIFWILMYLSNLKFLAMYPHGI